CASGPPRVLIDFDLGRAGLRVVVPEDLHERAVPRRALLDHHHAEEGPLLRADSPHTNCQHSVLQTTDYRLQTTDHDGGAEAPPYCRISAPRHCSTAALQHCST